MVKICKLKDIKYLFQNLQLVRKYFSVITYLSQID